MFEQSPQTPQLPDGLAVRFGYNGSAAAHEPPHIFGYGQPGIGGLLLQSFAFGCGHAYCASGGKARFPDGLFLHCLSAFQECEKRSAEHSRSPEAEPLASLWLAVSQLPTCKVEQGSGHESTLSSYSVCSA